MKYTNIILYQHWSHPNNILSLPLCIIKDDNTIDIIGRHVNDKRENIPYDASLPSGDMIEDGFLVYFTQFNAAHNMCNFIRAYYEYTKLDNKPHIYVTRGIFETPFIFKLFELLFKIDSYTIINENTNYECKSIYIPQYIWYTNAPEYPITYDMDGIIRVYNTNGALNTQYNELYDPLLLFNSVINKVYEDNKHKYKTYDNIFLVKSNLCSDSTTPGRQINLTLDIPEFLEKNNYLIVLPHKIEDVIEHIVQMKAAKNIITSYGGAACTNRFFFNEHATVKVICNVQYKSEYDLEWHNRCNAYMANKYIYFIDAPPFLNIDILNIFINYSA
jgi:hypothetical protein